jgi:hypothetical protein
VVSLQPAPPLDFFLDIVQCLYIEQNLYDVQETGLR